MNEHHVTQESTEQSKHKFLIEEIMPKKLPETNLPIIKLSEVEEGEGYNKMEIDETLRDVV